MSVVAFVAGLLAMVLLIPPFGAMGEPGGVLVMALVRGTALAHLLWRKAANQPWAEDVPATVVGAAVVTAVAWASAAVAGATGVVKGASVLKGAVTGSLVVPVVLYSTR